MEQDFENLKQAVLSFGPLKNQINFGFVGMLKNLDEANTFYNNANNIDNTNKAAGVIAISEKYPNDFQIDNGIEGYIKDFTINFPNWLSEQKEFLKNEINNTMMEGNNLKARSNNFLEGAMDMANAALVTIDACLILYPCDEGFFKLSKIALSNYHKTSQEFAAATYTNDYYAEQHLTN